MIVVNLLGAPGAGKSTGAAYIFSMLKMKGINAELVTEFVKDAAWENNDSVISDQIYIFGEQYHKIKRLENKVDVVVTDSPLFLSAIYNKHKIPLDKYFDDLVMYVFNSYDNLNYVITRDKKYNPKGRLQTEEESDEIHNQILHKLEENNINYTAVWGNINDYNIIVDQILQALENNYYRGIKE